MGGSWPSLLLAILAEVVATTALAASDGFTRPGPAAIAGVGYAGAFYLLSLALRILPTGVVYAVWSGLGVVLITAVSWIWAKQRLDGPALLGLALIVAGVLVLNLFSTTVRG